MDVLLPVEEQMESYREENEGVQKYISKNKETIKDITHSNLDSSPPVEIMFQGIKSLLIGFQLKLDNGDIKNFKLDTQRPWTVLGGPIIGFHFERERSYYMINFGLVIGDSCRPKYLGSRQVSFRFDEISKRTFFWQASNAKYMSACASKGIMQLRNM